MSQQSGQSNRRRMRRQFSKNSTKVHCRKGFCDLGANLARKLLDVSTDGARLVVAAPLDGNQEITLHLEGAWHPRPITIAAYVRWCLALADGNWCIGVQFQKTITYTDVQAFATPG